MSRILGLIYGALSYAIGMGSLFFAIFFLNNFLFAKTIDSGAPGTPVIAIIINLALCMVFALQHSIMPRRSFKQWFTRFVPVFAERSTYVLFSGLALILLYAYWQPMPDSVWSVETPALRYAVYGLQAFGWTWLVASTFMFDHFELFGLRQGWANLKARAMPAMHFRTPGFYKFVRHPIQLGVLISFWATPDMSVGRFLLCGAISGYILLALTQLEERDLIREFGAQYRNYQARVGLLLPKLPRRRKESRTALTRLISEL